MLVYGDHCEIVDPGERLQQIGQTLRQVADMPAGIQQHARLVGALIDGGQLLQGVEDAGAPSPELSTFLRRLADNVVRSCNSSYSDVGELPLLPELRLPSEVELRLPEGFAFYAVYPESYVEAVRKLVLSGEPRIIGIRSIGTTLAAVVAAGLGAPAPVSVRPFGDPFARRVELPPEVIDPGAHYVIVDEGPGLSGSSFGSVADWLEARGVPLERIAFLPSHAGDLGSEASHAHRERWARAQRVPAVLDMSFLERDFGPLQAFSTGHPSERLKYRASTSGGEVLLKFVGLGAIGERKVEMARALHARGFTPEALGLVHGFSAERWCEHSQALPAGEKPVVEIGRYIGARARLFPADDASGASIEELLSMCRRNIALALSEDATAPLDRWNPYEMSKRVRRVRTDNKLDREEWLRLADGRLLKTDALDHHQAHDLIGCQDVSWDVAGAIIEFELDAGEARQLIAATGRAVDAELIEFSLVAYCAFRLGHACLAAQSAPGNVAIVNRSERYAAHLRHLLHLHNCRATPRESLLG